MLTRTSVSSPCVVVPTIHTHPHVKVRYWHKADIEREVRKGRFYRESGHSLRRVATSGYRQSLKAGVANQDGCEPATNFRRLFSAPTSYVLEQIQSRI